MQERASHNNSFIYIKIPAVPLCVSYKVPPHLFRFWYFCTTFVLFSRGKRILKMLRMFTWFFPMLNIIIGRGLGTIY